MTGNGNWRFNGGAFGLCSCFFLPETKAIRFTAFMQTALLLSNAFCPVDRYTHMLLSTMAIKEWFKITKGGSVVKRSGFWS